jgi:NADPH-dependent F420 reductase
VFALASLVRHPSEPVTKGIAVLGGTGPEGLGIAARLAAAGEEVIVGSRLASRATEAATVLAREVPGGRVSGAPNADAAAAAGIAFVAVPLGGVGGILDECAAYLGGKIVVEVVNAVRAERGQFGAVETAEGLVARRIATRVPSARIVSALKHVSAANLRAIGRRLEGDVLLCADDESAKATVAELVHKMPDLRPVDAGGLAVAPLLDHVTALLLNLNRRHRTETSIRILGL